MAPHATSNQTHMVLKVPGAPADVHVPAGTSMDVVHKIGKMLYEFYNQAREGKFNTAESALAGERARRALSRKPNRAPDAVRRPKIFDILAARHKVPPGYALVRASDNSWHHVPASRLEEARQIDPKLTVLKNEQKSEKG